MIFAWNLSSVPIQQLIKSTGRHVSSSSDDKVETEVVGSLNAPFLAYLPTSDRLQAAERPWTLLPCSLRQSVTANILRMGDH
jgi:hypothetical protein